MTLTQQGRSRHVMPRLVAYLVAFAVLGVALYGLGVLMPYYVNNLDRLSLQEVTSNHDPKDLWPQGPFAGFVQLAGLLSIGFTPLILGASVLVGGGALLYGLFTKTERVSLGMAVALLCVVAGCVAGFGYVGSPMWSALATWRLD